VPSRSYSPPSPSSRAVERVSSLSTAFARACKQLGVKHLKIKPYGAQTSGMENSKPLSFHKNVGISWAKAWMRASTWSS
jgi:hypothetical protein